MHRRTLASPSFFALVVALASTAGISPRAVAQDRPWMNPSLTPDQRADLVLKELTLPEKVQLVHGIGWGPLRPGAPPPPDNNTRW